MYKIKLVNGSCYDVNVYQPSDLFRDKNIFKVSEDIFINPTHIVEIIKLEEKESFEDQIARKMEEMSYKNPLLDLELSDEEIARINKTFKDHMENFKPSIGFSVPKINIPELRK
jgi:hypothetical protein